VCHGVNCVWGFDVKPVVQRRAVIGCRLGADTSTERSPAVGDQVGRLQQQIWLWLPAVRRKRWYPVQRYDTHAAAHRWQVSHTYSSVTYLPTSTALSSVGHV